MSPPRVPRAVAIGAAIFALGCDSDEDVAPDELSEISSAASPVVVVREFSCLANQVPAGGGIMVSAIGAEAGKLVIKPNGTTCKFDLVYRTATDRVISATPGGYLLGDAVASGTTILACASDIEHGTHPNPPPLPGTGNLRWITRVPIDCMFRRTNGTWSPAVEVISGGTTAAAWLVDVRALAGGQFQVDYVHDSTFSFLNLWDEGRPATDRVRRLTIATASGAPVVTANVVIATSIRQALGTNGGAVQTLNPTGASDPFCQEFVANGRPNPCYQP